jgi:hypothetical protein
MMEVGHLRYALTSVPFWEENPIPFHFFFCHTSKTEIGLSLLMYRNITDSKQVVPITTHTSAEVSLVILVTINIPPLIVTSLEGLKFACVFIQDLWDVSIFHNVYHIDRQEMLIMKC